MAGRTWTDEDLAILATEPDDIKAAQKLGRSYNSVRIKRGRAPGTATKSQQTGDTWVLDLPKTRIKNLEELVEECQIDLSVWEVERLTVNKWESPVEGVAVPLFQVKAVLKRKKQDVTAVALELLEQVKNHAPSYPVIQREAGSGGILYEVSVPDLHLGKLAWREECGEDYDLGIAEEAFTAALLELLTHARHYRPAKILLVFGNDFFHTDNSQNTTTKGTPLDTDSRWPKVFSRGVSLCVYAIEQARAIAPVEALFVPGNHDTQSVFALGKAIECWFHNADDVTVDNRPTTRKYLEWGLVMLGFDHGDKIKHDDLPLQMATDEPQMWGRTRFREIHVGHLHKVGLLEKKGVRVRILPSLCSSDAWHVQNGFTGNIRSAEAYVWDRERGLIASFTHIANTQKVAA